jgi:hypothetical protein
VWNRVKIEKLDSHSFTFTCLGRVRLSVYSFFRNRARSFETTANWLQLFLDPKPNTTRPHHPTLTRFFWVSVGSEPFAHPYLKPFYIYTSCSWHPFHACIILDSHHIVFFRKLHHIVFNSNNNNLLFFYFYFYLFIYLLIKGSFYIAPRYPLWWCGTLRNCL